MYSELIKVVDKEQLLGIEIREQFWSVQKASRAGGYALFKKYGQVCNQEKRLAHWKEWWEKSGRHYTPESFKAQLFCVPSLAYCKILDFHLTYGLGEMFA